MSADDAGTDAETTSAGFEVGEAVVDREDGDPDVAFVLDLPDATADEWMAYTETTVADDNPEYPADAPIVIVAYEHSVRAHLADWDGEHGIGVQDDQQRAYHYAFPEPRLRADDDERTAADVTDAQGEDTVDTPEGDDVDGEDEPEPETEPTPEPSEATLALKERLEDSTSVEVEDDGETLHVEKLGSTYRVRPGEVVEGDGPLRGRLEGIVEDY